MRLIFDLFVWFKGVFVSQKKKLETPVSRELAEIGRLGQNLIVMQLGK